ncbi:MAG: alpha/beta hydrolase [Dehalococcoidales bacterium]|nr:alpha/beta hydrolase [Dehalococcoidales bacterium]
MNNKAISADGVSIAYRVEGSGNPTLVFVHGWCCDKSYWDPQVSYFAKKYRAVAVDLAGHGDSDLYRDTWTIAAFGEDIAAVVNQLAPKQVILVGHSLMGGAVILEAAQRIPAVIGIIAVDAPLNLTREAAQALLSRITALRSSSDEVARNAMSQFASGWFIETSDLSLVEKVTSDTSSVPRNIREDEAEAFLSYDLGKELEKITVPVWGIMHNDFNLEAIRQHCPSFEVVFMSGVGHFVMLEDPITFNRLLEEIIQNLAG